MIGAWEVWPVRWPFYKVAKRVYGDQFGSGYIFARNDSGNVIRFFSKARAEKHAVKLNAANPEQAR